MPNDYYNYSNDFIPGAKVRSQTHDQQFTALEAAFDLLSDPTKVGNGASVGGTDTGTADNYVVDNGATGVLVDLQMQTYTPAYTNTGASVVAVNGGANKTIVRNDGSAVQAGDLIAGVPVMMIWDSANDRWTLVGATATQVASQLRPTVTTQTGTAYTLALGDENSIILFTNGSAVTVTVPNDTTNPEIPAGYIAHLNQNGAGALSAAAAAGVTIRYAYALAARTQYASISLMKTAANTWVLIGDVG